MNDNLRNKQLWCLANKKFNKVFGIGLNKTGTTTLSKIFFDCGLRIAPQHDGELAGIQALAGNMTPLVGYINKYDAFQDVPFSIKSFYAQIDALFPNSKFILTIRDKEDWFKSFSTYYRSKLFCADDKYPSLESIKNRKYLYPGYYYQISQANWFINIDEDYKLIKNSELLLNKNNCIEIYDNRNKEVIRHFSERPRDLLVIDLSEENDTQKIVDFLGLPKGFITGVPHLNKFNA